MKPVYNKATPLPTTTKEYVEFEQMVNFQVGESVRVIRTARTYEGGWNNSWNSDMDAYIGNTYEVDSTGRPDGSGITLDMFRFPYFVLERVLREEG